MREERKSILEEAEEAVQGPRRQDYGNPSDNHDTTAILWACYLSARRRNENFSPEGIDVCIMNILQKISRIANGQVTRDSLIDIAGYARNAEIILHETEEVATTQEQEQQSDQQK